MKIDIDTLGLKELDALLAAAEQRKQLLSRRRPVGVVRKELEAFALSQGYTIEALIDVQPASVATKPARRRKRVRVAAKYRDPENRRNTWSGRGRMPRWLADRIKRGQSVADFLIPGLGRPTAKTNRAIGQRSVYKKG